MHATTVPVIDLERFDYDRATFLAEMGEAYRTFGFCCFSNHGIPEDTLEQAYASFRAFFALPLEAKLRYVAQRKPGTRGYTPNKVETAVTANIADLKEFWHVGREVSGGNPFPDILLPNLWPSEVPGFREHALVLYAAMERVGRRLLGALAINIGLPESFFDGQLDYGNSILRALHYPPIRAEDMPAVRAAAHEDISMITILVGATDSGLELLLRKPDGSPDRWLPIEAPRGAIIVNVGDMLQRLTNHVYPSTTHRVINPEGPGALRPRYSLPFFMDPDPNYLIRTVPSCITPANPNRYPNPITADDYLMERLRAIKMTA